MHEQSFIRKKNKEKFNKNHGKNDKFVGDFIIPIIQAIERSIFVIT